MSLTAVKIPEDILVEILVRLPGRSLMRFKCVSKCWSSLISSRYFIDLFFKISSSITRERHVFMCVAGLHDLCAVFSSSLNNLDATTDSFLELHRDLTLPLIKDGLKLKFVNTLRGLMCFRLGREIRIINLTTSQVLSLPLVKSNMVSEGDSDMWNYFGFDHVNDEYKVLNTITTKEGWRVTKEGWRVKVKSETQVLVMGAGASWRNTKSLTSPPPHHRPKGKGIFINGVLYYAASHHEKRFVLMSFDFNSEEFTLIEFPIEVNRDGYPHLINLMNYRDQAAVFDLKTERILDLWVLEDAKKRKWSHESFVLPCHQLRQSLNIDSLLIRGTSRSGEIMLSERYESTKTKTITHVICDLDRGCITRGFVTMSPSISFRLFETTLFDDVENIMYLEA